MTNEMKKMMEKVKAGKERVARKREEFMQSLKGLDLAKETIVEIEELVESMMSSNEIGEKELAVAFKEEIKRVILKDVGGKKIR